MKIGIIVIYLKIYILLFSRLGKELSQIKEKEWGLYINSGLWHKGSLLFKHIL